MALPAHPLHSETGTAKLPNHGMKSSKLMPSSPPMNGTYCTHPTLVSVSAELPCLSARFQPSQTGQQDNISTSPRASVSRTIVSPLVCSWGLCQRSPLEPHHVRTPPSSSSSSSLLPSSNILFLTGRMILAAITLCRTETL